MRWLINFALLLIRKAILVDVCKHDKIRIMMDAQNASEILPYIMRKGVLDEFEKIKESLKAGARSREYYCKCDVSAKAEHMFEMRFRGQGRNDRIYCKEVRTPKRLHIIMTELFEGKKTQEIPPRIRKRIENIGRNYEYDL